MNQSAKEIFDGDLPNQNNFVERSPRRTAYIHGRVRKFKWLRVMSVDTEIVDVSETGIKLRFGRNVAAIPGGVFWIELPTFDDPEEFQTTKSYKVVKAECRWYDGNTHTLGAIIHADHHDQEVVDGLIAVLQKIGRLPA